MQKGAGMRENEEDEGKGRQACTLKAVSTPPLKKARYLRYLRQAK